MVCVVSVFVVRVVSDKSYWKCVVLILLLKCSRNLAKAFREESWFVRDQGVELAVCFSVEVMYRQQGVTTIGGKQSLAYEVAIVCSDA